MTDDVEYREPQVRMNVKQTAKGYSYYDVTTRAETVDEALLLLKDAAEKLSALVGDANSRLDVMLK